MSHLAGLLLHVASVLAAAAEPSLVLLLEDRTALALAPGGELPVEDLAHLESFWRWSGIAPPERIDEIGRIAEPIAPQPFPLLSIDVGGRQRPARGERPRSVRVIAAPRPMWEQVPEALLPSREVALPETLRLPHRPEEPWRARLVGEGEGSAWVDLPPGRASLALAARPAEDVEVGVVDAGGESVPAARLSVLDPGPGGRRPRKLADYRADEGGRVSLPGLPIGLPLVLLVSADGYVPRLLRTTPAELSAEEVVLDAGARLSGRVVDPEAGPLSGVTVRLRAWVSDELPIPYERYARSGRDGGFELAGVPPGKVEVALLVPGFPVAPRLFELEAGEAPLGDLVLWPGNDLVVEVVDDLGRPVAGARVRGRPGAEPVPTDRSGLATLALPPERLELEVEADGHLPAREGVGLPLPESVRVELARAARVVGQLVNARTGALVTDGSVRIETGNGSYRHALGADGRFELDLRPGRRHRLVFSSPAVRGLELTVEPAAPGETVDLGEVAVEPGATVVGRLLDASEATPIAGARVWTLRGSSDPLLAWLFEDFVETRSDREGRFVLSGLAASPPPVRIDAPGHARRRLDLGPLEADEVEDLGELFLDRGARLTVVAGEVETGTMARLALGGGPLPADRLESRIVSGEAVFPHVPAGEAALSLVREDRLLCQRRLEVPEGGEITVRCEDEPLEVSGVVFLGDRAVGPGLLRWFPESSETTDVIMNFGSGALRQQHSYGGGFDVEVPVDAAGRFLTEHLRPGAWDVLFIPDEGVSAGPVAVRLGAGPQVGVAVRFPGLSVAGRVVDLDGEPVENAHIRTAAGSAFALSEPDGSFVLGGLEPGVHRLVARLRDRVSEEVEVEVGAERLAPPVELVVGSGRRRTLEVRLVDSKGDAVGGGFAFVDLEGRPLRVLTPDAAGRVSLTLEPPLPRRVRLAGVDGRGNWSFGDWVPLDRTLETPLSLRFEPTGALRVEAAEPLSGVRLIVAGTGWDLTELSAWLGSPPVADAVGTFRAVGLPPGRYLVRLADREEVVRVEAGDETRLALD